MEERIYCPADSYDCPYYGYDGRCHMDNPRDDCDDFYAAVGDAEDEDEGEG